MSAYDFEPNWDTQAVLVEEMQRMAKRIEDLEAMLESQTAPAQPTDEPVAWARSDTVVGWKGQLMNIAYMFPSPKGLKNPIPLYTRPQPARELVGLTDDEVGDAANNANTYTEAVQMTQAKLKEKNT
jgi:hypothetical protein